MTVTIQYIIVGAILAGTAIWIGVRILRKKNNKDSGCFGCTLKDTCRYKKTTHR